MLFRLRYGRRSGWDADRNDENGHRHRGADPESGILFFHELWSPVRGLRHEAEVGVRKAPEVWEHRRHIGLGDAEPFRECGAVFVHACRGNPGSAAAGVARAAELKNGIASVGALTADSAAEDQTPGTLAADDSFIPTVEISEDLSVSFPADI